MDPEQQPLGSLASPLETALSLLLGLHDLAQAVEKL